MHILSFLLFFALGCAPLVPQHGEKQLGVNQPQHHERPIVLLISLDGYRHDYNQLYKPPFLSEFAKDSARTQGLIPTYPTNTFPNHYSIVTGLYPDKHGIVSNSFYSPELNLSYSLKDPKAVTNGDFYEGIPLWSLARRQGMVSATYFWPGSEAPIAGVYPTYYRAYDHSAPHQERVSTVLNWLKLPKENRPHFVTLYFSDVDSAGHAYGPNSPQVEQAIMKVDQTLAGLYQEVQKLKLPIITMIVSDHGMTALSFDRVEYLDPHFQTAEEKTSWKHFETHGMGPFLFHYYQGPEKEKAQHTKRALKALARGKHFKSYQRGKLPAHLNFNHSPRMGEIVTISSPGYSVGERGKLRVIAGSHGFDPTLSSDMMGIFYARGPGLVARELPPFENIHVYPLVAKLLGLELESEIDGRLEVTTPLLEGK